VLVVMVMVVVVSESMVGIVVVVVIVIVVVGKKSLCLEVWKVQCRVAVGFKRFRVMPCCDSGRYSWL